MYLTDLYKKGASFFDGARHVVELDAWKAVWEGFEKAMTFPKIISGLKKCGFFFISSSVVCENETKCSLSDNPVLPKIF